MLLRTIYLSLDPYMRGRMNAGPSYAAPVEVGEVMVGRSVCEVVESNLPSYQSSEIVAASTGWQEYSCPTVKGHERSIGYSVPFPTPSVCSGCQDLPPNRAIEHRKTSARRDGRRCRRFGRRRFGRRPDRQDQRLPSRRHCGRGNKMPLRRGRTGI